METMISVHSALELITNHVKSLPVEVMQLEKANGFVLAEDIYAPENVPAFPQSSMDGYAFAFDNNRSDYKIVGEIAAGSKQTFELKQGEAVRIFTGAAVPLAADTVLMQEKALVESDKLTVNDESLNKGTNLRSIGSEIKKGTKALEKGTVLKPATIGFLASMGIAKVKVYPNPSVGILVTGNELRLPGEDLEYGQVFESNSFTLQSALNQLNINNVTIYRSEDNLNQLQTLLSQILEVNDLVLISGGVSVGDYDFTMDALEKCDVNAVFHKIKQKPGKPLLFGTKADKVIFGLPGNPASVLTCFYEYVLPAIGIMTERNVKLQAKKMVLTQEYQKQVGMTHFLKASHNNDLVYLETGQESYKLSSFANANCLAIIPENTSKIESGQEIEVHLFPF
ncbi:molybdopterin molybdotransferase MoeA [Flavobacterium yafengii]|uniref:Molybdopterin molybdenumtransferase n=1 Tax=Flavobacterium yafengii TaxID=3041253 RepID=A0AAW6TQ14_9FLAO|nr:gephyrin-like molybdotransferase Glp [Flavobacterium yafengii]MDI5949763.1 molybdopterin molybdotransferase MoeA [Flavobacterium yafengii]